MIGFLLRRFAQAVIVILGVSLIVFFLARLVPGGEARAVLQTRATPKLIAQFNRQNGLSLPIWDQLYRYIKGLVWPIWDPNLGYSYKFNEGVRSIIGQRLPRTLLLVGFSTIISLVIAIPLGIIQVVRRNTIVDYALTGLSFVLYAMPAFLLGTLLIVYFALDNHLFPVDAPTGSPWLIVTDPR